MNRLPRISRLATTPRNTVRLPTTARGVNEATVVSVPMIAVAIVAVAETVLNSAAAGAVFVVADVGAVVAISVRAAAAVIFLHPSMLRHKAATAIVVMIAGATKIAATTAAIAVTVAMIA